jgi:DNA-binding response OmpR family regulator
MNTAQAAARTALVVDYDTWERSFAMAVLADHGYATLGASNGASGLRLVERNECDVILLDFALPEMSGRELLRQLRNLDATRNIPVVALGNRRDERSCPVDGWLARPLTQTDVMDEVARVVAAPYPQRQPRPTSHARGTGPLVLIASPDRELAARVADRMRSTGSAACTAHSADGCLRVATAVGPDVVLLDPRLAAHKDLEKLLRAHPVSASADIVALPDVVSLPVSRPGSGIASVG